MTIELADTIDFLQKVNKSKMFILLDKLPFDTNADGSIRLTLAHKVGNFENLTLEVSLTYIGNKLVFKSYDASTGNISWDVAFEADKITILNTIVTSGNDYVYKTKNQVTIEEGEVRDTYCIEEESVGIEHSVDSLSEGTLSPENQAKVLNQLVSTLNTLEVIKNAITNYKREMSINIQRFFKGIDTPSSIHTKAIPSVPDEVQSLIIEYLV